jgi:predicted 3-demethylubiquinone-9 3-methyltransferase (glyoxalase superfamily)
MQKIVPHLWFDKEAKEAAAFYVSVFGRDSKVTHQSELHDTPSGDVDMVAFELWGYEFQAISAGPYFKLNQSISFMVNFDPSQDAEAKTRIDEIWNKLALGGKVMMALDQYPWSERYGWVEDKYGVSWQLILTKPEGEERPLIIPSLLFVNEKYGKAEEAVDFYLSVFKSSKLGTRMKYGPGQEPNKEGAVMFSDFQLFDEWFTAMDGGGKHGFDFNEALSLMVRCDSQEEIDYYWEKLSAVPESEQCGWLKDKYGVSWQIVPTAMDEMMAKGTPEQIARVTKAFLQMKKFDIAELEKAYRVE